MPASNATPASTAKSPASAATRKGSKYPGPVATIIVLASIALIVAVRWLSVAEDLPKDGMLGKFLAFFASHAVANIFTLIFAFSALMTLNIWLFFFSGYSVRLRHWVIRAQVLAVALFFGLNRLEGVDGDMRPIFKPRFEFRNGWLCFTQRADEQLDPIDLRTDPIDLATATPRDFPGFLGPFRSGSLDAWQLDPDWQASPPRQVWEIDVGAGWSGFAARNGFAVTLEQRGDREVVACYEIATGKPRWRTSVAALFTSKLAGTGPRSTPTIHDGYVYTLGSTGWLLCLDGSTGDVVWKKNLLAEYGIDDGDEAREMMYGRANSPLVVDNLVIVPVGGPKENRIGLAALDRKTGRTVWTGGKNQAGYASPCLAIIAGVRQIIIVNEATVSGHNAASGEQLWEFPWPGSSSGAANCSQAHAIGNDRIFVSKEYSTGGALYQIEKAPAGEWKTEELWHDHRVMKTKFTNVAIRDGYAYGLSDGLLECIELETGKRMWKANKRYCQGQILRVGGWLLVQSEHEGVFLVEASPTNKHHVAGNIPGLEGEAWNNLCLAGPYLLIRTNLKAACYELKMLP